MKKGKSSDSGKSSVKRSGKAVAQDAGDAQNWLSLRVREGLMLAFLVLGLYLLMSLVSYSPDDPGWTRIGPVGDVQNMGGRA
ncbi:DNA translocase FtsK 4TM domain-containing protein, partial [Parendozoicomonas sp. Alg238-R29]|uniref:DNA translocase FtsK 4TM domain-containing protein n=1 Tax=Parendozoicomonas sp. Alg238-R29 TaxID=2993446 RepID=UPI00248EF04E